MNNALELSKQQIKDAVLQNGYVVARSESHEGAERILFFKPHDMEFLTKEAADVNHVEFKLFYAGCIALSWIKEIDGDVGRITMYCHGLISYTQDWSNFISDEDAYRIENDRDGPALHVYSAKTQYLIYRGSFDENDKRDGFGYGYDADTGRCLFYGYFINDELQGKLQEFLEDDTMIEYGDDCYYKGGCIYNENEDRYLRDGAGTVYYDGDVTYSSRWSNGHEDALLFVDKSEDFLLTQTLGSILISSNCCNEARFTTLRLLSMPMLTSVTVEDDCFAHVEMVMLQSLPKLTVFKVGSRSFTEAPDGCALNTKRSFSVWSCPRLHTLSIGDHSFSDYSIFLLADLNALETLSIGAIGTDSSCFAFSALVLSRLVLLLLSRLDLPELTHVRLGDRCFMYAPIVQFASLSALKRIDLGEAACCGSGEPGCKVFFSALPRLYSIQSVRYSFQAMRELHCDSSLSAGV